MAGFLPRVRPSIGSYGKMVVDRRPAKDLDRESPAEDFNNTRTDVAFMAQGCPLLVVRIANDGTQAVVLWHAPAEFVAMPKVVRLEPGVVRVLLPAGVRASSASASIHGQTPMPYALELVSAAAVVVRTPADVGFELQVR